MHAESNTEDQRNGWSQNVGRKNQREQFSALPMQLPGGADLPSCTGEKACDLCFLLKQVFFLETFFTKKG